MKKVEEAKVKRQKRLEAKCLREEAKAERAADQAFRKAAQEAAQQLKQAQKNPQEGKRRSLKPPTKAASKYRGCGKPGDGGGPAQGE